MGSSKRKHSKKKNLKVSSEVRRKKKIRKNKSKKLRHDDDSFSSYSDDESSSSSGFSSSSSEGEYKSKKSCSRSRARKEVKSSKKRTRKRSLSEDSSKDSPPMKKRKGSKKKNKKIKKKKKPKRDAYISSSSSDSASCSTCKDSSSDDVALPRLRSREKRKGHRDSTKGKIGNMKNRSWSCSSPSNGYDDENIENVMVENNPRRLKSVITVAKQDEEDQDDMKKDELKEEIVYDYDDYPSCKSNDSNELVDRFNVSPDKNPTTTSVISEVNSVSEVDDLESILRQKALENLSKFRGGIKAKTVANVDDKYKSDQMTSASVDFGQQPVIPRSRFTWRRDQSVTTVKDEKAAEPYSGPHSSGLQPKNKIVNETSEIRANTNVDQKSTTALETPSSAASTKAGSSNEQKIDTSESGGTGTNVDQKSTTVLETPQNETNDNSQFEKKTMNVMRGGEMVQVSYKVYIPNRAPALARRQLKR